MQSALLLVVAAFTVPLLGAQSRITLLLIDGKIWRGDADKPAEAVAIAGNRIAAVGSSTQITKLKQAGTWMFDLHGHLVLPGFDDERVHFYQGGSDLMGPQLRFASSAGELRDTLAEFVESNGAKGQWVTGGNWDCKGWKKHCPPTHKLIDSVTKNRPVFLKSADGRMWLANRLALQLAGIDRNTPDPDGGIILHDAKGDPTGILEGTAGKLVERVIPPPSPDRIFSTLEYAEAYANSRGVTSIRDVSCTPAVLSGYRTLLAAHRLTVRVQCVPPGSPESNGSGSDWDDGPMNVAAYAEKSAKCSIKAGKRADLVVLSNQRFNTDTRVIATFVNGVPVYGQLWPVRDKSGLILR